MIRFTSAGGAVNGQELLGFAGQDVPVEMEAGCQ